MNWKLVTVGAGCLVGLAAQLINESANKHYKKITEQKAQESVSEETKNEIKNAREMLKTADDVAKREHKQIYDGIRSWKREKDYDLRLQEARDLKVSELEDQKLAINYYVRKNEIEETYETELESFKESIDFDYEIDLNEGIIEDAEEAYEKRCKKIKDVSGSDEEISDALKDLKKNEKEKRDETVKEAKARIAELKQKVNAEENRLNRKRQAELRTLEGELQPTKLRLEKAETEACNQINSERMKAEEEIRASVKSKRTRKEQLAIDNQDECAKFLEEQKNEEDKNAWLLYEEACTSEKWGAYLKEVKCPRWIVAFVGALPLIPVGFAIEKYVKFVVNVIRAM